MSTVLPNVTGGILSDIIIWVRRLIKSPSTESISDAVIADYINRFWTYDVAERIQLFEMKRQYTFETVPNIFEYPAPFTSALSNKFPGASIPPAPPFIPNPPSNAQQAQTLVPVYQNFRPPVYADGVQMGWYQSNDQFYKIFPELVLNETPLLGNGTTGSFIANFSRNPIQRAYIDDLGNLLPYVYITTLTPNGQLQYIVDSGYVDNDGLGILIQTDSTFQNIIGAQLTGTPPDSGGCGRVNYITGVATFSFLQNTITGANIETQTSPYSSGFPRVCLFYNNTFKLYPIPDRAYKIQMDAYITPIVFFNTGASIPFAYMSEYIARGSARKILSDTGDYDQFAFYETLFREQENLVLRRTDRQKAVERTPTIFSAQMSNNPFIYTQY